ncbi:MAG TPA: metal-dependent hydrolase [Armatimonadota bacterium]|nr:metal-dependent hydrolase [Armatimonadota bacterium]
MAQNGFHGLVGLWTAGKTARWAPRAELAPWVAGVVVGAMLPDVDLYPTAVIFLLGRHDLIYSVHRTLTHSLLLMLVVLAVGVVHRRRWFWWGLAAGMGTHTMLDIFFWFSPVDLFWPLSHFPHKAPLLPIIDLWKWVKLPPVFGNPAFINNVLAAGDFAALALYLGSLRGTMTRGGWAKADAAAMHHWERALWAAFVIAVGAAPALSGNAQQILVTTPLLTVFLPYCWSQTWRLRETLARGILQP